MEPDERQEQEAGFEGWLFLRSDSVPEKWHDRAISVSLVPRLAGELEGVVSGDGVEFVPEPEDVVLYKLIARGLPAPAIARELGIATRSVHRRLARLRERLGVETTAQLAAAFARRGF